MDKSLRNGKVTHLWNHSAHGWLIFGSVCSFTTIGSITESLSLFGSVGFTLHSLSWQEFGRTMPQQRHCYWPAWYWSTNLPTGAWRCSRAPRVWCSSHWSFLAGLWKWDSEADTSCTGCAGENTGALAESEPRVLFTTVPMIWIAVLPSDQMKKQSTYFALCTRYVESHCPSNHICSFSVYQSI